MDEGRWTIAQIAEVLREELRDVNPKVSVDAKREITSLVIDPVSAMTLSFPIREDSDEEPHYEAESWSIRWVDGAPTEVEVWQRRMDARLGMDGQLVIGRGEGSTPYEQRSATENALLQARHQEPAAFDITSTQLCALVDDIAVRAGRVTPQQLAEAPPRDLDFRRRRIVRQVSGPGDPVIRAFEQPGAADGAASAAASPSAAIRGPRTGFAMSEEEIAVYEVEQAERSARATVEHAEFQKEWGASTRRIARVMTIIGFGIILACLLATGIGLMAGMVWWASFIIVGGGLLFCLLFVLPFVLIARSTPREGAEV